MQTPVLDAVPVPSAPDAGPPDTDPSAPAAGTPDSAAMDRLSLYRTQARCRYCGQFFGYELRPLKRRVQFRSRHVCDACLRTRQHRNPPPQFLPGDGIDSLPGDFADQWEIALQTGLTPFQVEEAERRALAKLRSSPELREAYELFKADGMPQVHLLRKHLRVALKAREQALLRQLQTEIVDWWRVHDLALAQGLNEEASEIREAIFESRLLLAKELDLQKS